MRVCIMGLGEVGLPTAKYIKDRGIEVWGYDIDLAAVDLSQKQGIANATSNWREVSPADIYVICVSTKLRKGLPNLSAVLDVCNKIPQRATSPCLVSIESTVIPGTSRKIFEDILGRRVSLVHVPHRYWSGDPVRHGVKQMRVIGAIDSESLSRGLKFYRDILEIPLHIAPTIEVAELSKVAENSYRYIQIAFAEELRMMCERINLDFVETRKACNTKWNIDIPEARDGIGGHCLPKDLRYLTSLTIRNHLLESAILVDKEYRRWIVKSGRG